MPTYLGCWLPQAGFVPSETSFSGVYDTLDQHELAHLQWLPKEFWLTIDGIFNGTPFSYSSSVPVPSRSGMTTLQDLWDDVATGTPHLLQAGLSDTFSIGSDTAEITLEIGYEGLIDMPPQRETGSIANFWPFFRFNLNVAGLYSLSTPIPGALTLYRGDFTVDSSLVPYSPGFTFVWPLNENGTSKFSSMSVNLTITDYLTI